MERAQDNTPEPTPADTFVGGVTGWLFILVGSAAVAAAGLIPAYYETISVQEARAVEAVKAQMLADERQRYEDFHQALSEDDPVLLERLALTELRLRPPGTGLASRASFDPLAVVASPNEDEINQALATQPLMRSIENELSRPDLKQQAHIEVQFDRPRQTRLISAATGEHRPWVAGFGALMLLMGLWPRRAAG